MIEGDYIKITASKYPFPTVCANEQSTDWFQAISHMLTWNERERQESSVVVEEGPARPKKRENKPDGQLPTKSTIPEFEDDSDLQR